jgi:Cytochrome P460
MRTFITVTTLGVAALIYVCGLGAADRDTSEAEKIRGYLMRHRKEMTRVTSKPYHVKSVGSPQCYDPDSFPHRMHEEHWIHVFVSPSGTNAMATGKGTYPVATVILKQKFWDAGGTNTEFYTGMRKRERSYNPKSGDWEFFTLDRGGQNVTALGNIGESCMNCHAKYKATDFVSRRYLNTKEDAGW